MQVITGVNTQKKQFRITDFKNVANIHRNLIVQKDGVYSGYGKVDTGLSVSESKVERLYGVGGRVFVFCADGNLYECASGAVKNKLYLEQAPALSEIIYGGKSCVLVAGKSSSTYVLTDDGYERIENAQEANRLIVHSGRVFTAHGGLVTFSKLFDFDNQTTVFSGGGSISLAHSSGEVVGFYSQERKLYIICKRAIYRLSTFGESIDFNLEKLPSPNINVESGSVRALYDSCLFVSNGKLYSLSGAKISRVCSLPEQIDGCVLGEAAVSQDAYLLPIEKDGEKFVYAYDFISGSESLLTVNCAVVADGGYIVDGGSIFRLDVMGSDCGQGEYISKPLNFDSLQKKTVLGVCAFVSSKCNISVSSEYGKNALSFKKGYNRKKLNLDGNQFTITATCAGTGFSLSDLRIDYAIRGNYAI